MHQPWEKIVSIRFSVFVPSLPHNHQTSDYALVQLPCVLGQTVVSTFATFHEQHVRFVVDLIEDC